MEDIIIDTGPLVARYCQSDQAHRWVREQLARFTAPLVTCEAVLTEACYLIARERQDPSSIVRAVREGFLRVRFEISDEAASLELLMKRYADAPMSLADACLVRLSELHKNCRVFTLDRHFKRYRRYGRSVIPLLSPW